MNGDDPRPDSRVLHRHAHSPCKQNRDDGGTATVQAAQEAPDVQEYPVAY